MEGNTRGKSSCCGSLRARQKERRPVCSGRCIAGRRKGQRGRKMKKTCIGDRAGDASKGDTDKREREIARTRLAHTHKRTTVK